MGALLKSRPIDQMLEKKWQVDLHYEWTELASNNSEATAAKGRLTVGQVEQTMGLLPQVFAAVIADHTQNPRTAEWSAGMRVSERSRPTINIAQVYALEGPFGQLKDIRMLRSGGIYQGESARRENGFVLRLGIFGEGTGQHQQNGVQCGI